MAGPDTRTGSQCALYLGDKATPTNFKFVCGIEVTNNTISRAENRKTMRDCADPFAIPVVRRKLGAKDHVISGTGLVSIDDADGADLGDLLDVQDDDDNYYWKVEIEDGPTWTGKFSLSVVELGADASTDEDGYQTVAITLGADGAITRS